MDALVNYLTVAGYPGDMAKFRAVWPAAVHVFGKDILRFHAIYWPAFLLAAGFDLPKRLVCHGHWLVDGRKMSKSVGNVLDPFACLDQFSQDGLRYFLLREGVLDTDSSISEEKISKFSDAELANTLGNLYQVTTNNTGLQTHLPS
jgi:methionyl-tRNA synthetase